jgi:cytochrome c oxidase subunit 2
MKFGDITRKWLQVLPLIAALLALVSLPQASLAQAAGSTPLPAQSGVQVPSADAQSVNVANENTPPAAAAEPSVAEAAPGADAGAYTPLGPEWIKGQPTPGALTFQKQYSKIGDEALFMHDVVLLPVITVVTLLVLALLLWVVVRYNRRRNPVPSKTSHNTLIEVIWTAVPVLILVVIAVPSITLLAHQYQSPPKDAVTVKVTGYQWYWGYTYPDNGGFEVISNMLPDEEALARGEPTHLAADNRMVVPAGEPIRLQVTAADVIHAFAVPSLWFKIDAVPGRLNERMLFVKEPGIYYGQCSELCGARHGYMPIVVEALPRPQFEAFIRSQGGTLGGEAAAPAPAAAPQQQPESSVEGAPGAGAAPTAAVAPGKEA